MGRNNPAFTMVARCVSQAKLFSVNGDLFLERGEGEQRIKREREVLILAVTNELNYSGRGTDAFQVAGGDFNNETHNEYML